MCNPEPASYVRHDHSQTIEVFGKVRKPTLGSLHRSRGVAAKRRHSPVSASCKRNACNSSSSHPSNCLRHQFTSLYATIHAYAIQFHPTSRYTISLLLQAKTSISRLPPLYTQRSCSKDKKLHGLALLFAPPRFLDKEYDVSCCLKSFALVTFYCKSLCLVAWTRRIWNVH